MAETLWGRVRTDFPDTRWSEVMRAGRGAREALSALCRMYWGPVYCYFRAQTAGRQQADDLTQGLFAKLLEPGALARLEPRAGRFRSWLRACARNYLCNHIDSEGRRPPGRRAVVILADEDLSGEDAWVAAQRDVRPDEIFDRRWRESLYERVVARLRETAVREGLGERFAALAVRHADEPSAHPPLTGRERVALFRLRQLCSTWVRREIADTVGPGDVSAELRHLIGDA